MATKIYTKTGDKGYTSLFGGARLRKDHVQVEAYGTVDELNSNLGFLITLLESSVQEDVDLLTQVQSQLFSCGSLLAATLEKRKELPGLANSEVSRLEDAIDRLAGELPALKNFILPGGTKAAAVAHVCRSVCRRAERRVITHDDQEGIYSDIIVYLNRLSDYLFVLARHLNTRAGREDIPWKSPI